MDIFHPLYKFKHRLLKCQTKFLWIFFPFIVKSNKKKGLIRINSEFISINAYLTGGCLLIPEEQQALYCSRDTELSLLGQYVREKLNESEEISRDRMFGILNRMIKNGTIHNSLSDKDFLFLNRKNTLNNRKKLYRNMHYLVIQLDKQFIKIYPQHQIKLDEFEGIIINDKELYFEYPINITNEALGKAIMNACNACTSIYSHYLKYEE